MWLAFTIAVRHYCNKVTDFIASKLGWIITAVTAISVLAIVYLTRGMWTKRTSPESTASKARADLKVLEQRYAQADAEASALHKQDAVLEAKAQDLATKIEVHKAAIVELETRRAIDWDSLSDAEIDAKFKAAGL